MQYRDEDDEDEDDDFVGDGFLLVGELKHFLNDVPDDMKIYLEKVEQPYIFLA